MQRKGEKSLALCRQECLRHVGLATSDFSPLARIQAGLVICF